MSQIGEIQAPVTLSRGQQDALLRTLNAAPGDFYFVTGKAGAGKSTVLRELIQARRCIVCAPTGIGAINVRGVSMHSAFKLPVGPIVKSRIKGISWDDDVRVIEMADIIVIDEISMVRADLLDGLNWQLQKTLRNKAPFGGKAIVAFGDMCQLNPVVKDEDKEFIRQHYRSEFWFDAKVLQPPMQATLEDPEEPSTRIQICELDEVFRQRDPEFVDALNKIRLGDPSGLDFINRRAGILPPKEAMPVALTYTNARADIINAERLAALPGNILEFNAIIDGDFGKERPVPETLALKVGAQVMFTRNLGGGVANGTVGEIIGFKGDAPIITLRDGTLVLAERQRWDRIEYVLDAETKIMAEEVKGYYSQYPIKLAWAITTHKAQGQTLEAAVLELEMPTFTHGMLYVALSRVQTFEGLYLRRKLAPKDIRFSPRVREFMSPTKQPIDIGAIL